VFFEHEDVDPGAREQQAEHRAGGTAPGNAASRLDHPRWRCTARAKVGHARAVEHDSFVAQRKQEPDVIVVGASVHPLRDLYHGLLQARWSTLLCLIAAGFLLLNALFALLYMRLGGITGAQAGSFRDAFFFSVQTMGTIGYGSLYPTSTAANVVMVAESVVGLIFTALATGIVFARFSRTTGELVFSRHVVISLMDGVPTLSFRVGNDRSSTIFEARVTATMFRTERTQEGVLFYRMYDLELVRAQSQALQRSFTCMHRITEKSPFFGATPDTCVKNEIELQVAVVGTDETSLQPVHARWRYDTKDIVWGARLADVLRERPDGKIEMDVGKFHGIVPTKPTPDFPYPRED
jgi:inward rectifier potassium channel